LRRGTAEIGLHVHPWSSPPFSGGIDCDNSHIYLYELADDLIYAKLKFLTSLLTEIFDIRPVSHRGGRWGLDSRVAQILVNLGYLVDCSVAPGFSWKRYKGATDGRGGPDYFDFPITPYFLSLDNIRYPGSSPLLEVPLTVKPNYRTIVQKFHHPIENALIGKILRRVLGPPYTPLRPIGENVDGLLAVVEWAFVQQLPVLEFMLHSSELMPSGSPTFKTEEAIEVLYQNLGILFNRIRCLGARSMTLSEYRLVWS